MTKLKWMITRLFKRLVTGVDPQELWSLDYHTAKYILKRLKLLKPILQGYPDYLLERDEQLHIAFKERHVVNSFEDNDEYLFTLWIWAIEQMIIAFEYIVLDNDDLFDGILSDKDIYTIIVKRNKQIEFGLELYGRYFRALYD